MLDNETKRRIDTARDVLVGKVPDPKSQVEQITIALIYKFMDDMDKESVGMGGKPSFFIGEYGKYSWSKIFDPRLGGFEVLALYADAITRMSMNPNLPQLFRDIFKNAYLPYRDPETLKLFLKTINEFNYDHSERLGDAFEYLLSVLGSQGEAGQFRTPRHIIDFMVEVIKPQKNEFILDPACGTAGFLISSYKHIIKDNTKKIHGDLLTPEERRKLLANFKGYDISPDMVRLSLVNLYLHGFVQPQILEYDTLTSEDRWNECADVILANPPFMSPKGGIKPHKKFSVQSNRSEVLFVDYIAEHLRPTGRAGVIVPEGIIFQSANAYKQLRKYLVDNDYLWAVVSLPAGVFNPYSGVKTSILLMDRVIAKKTDKILFVKVDNDGFDLGAQRRPNGKNDLPGATNVLVDWLKAVRNGKTKDFNIEEKPCGALLVDKAKLAENGDYNLTGDRYRATEKKAHQKWPMVRLGEVCSFEYGKSLPEKARIDGPYPVMGSNGRTGFHNEFLVKGPAIIIGRKGSSGEVVWEESNCFPIDTTYYVKADAQRINLKWLYHILKSMGLKNLSGGAGIPGLNRNDAYDKKIPLPPLEVQREIVAEIEGYQKIIDGARQVVESWKPQIEINPEWPKATIGECCEVKGGKRLPMGEQFTNTPTNHPYIRVTDFRDQSVDLNNLKFIPEAVYQQIARYTISSADVYISIAGTIGLMGTVPESLNGANLTENAAKLVFDARMIDKRFLSIVGNGDSVQKQIRSLTHAVGVPKLALERIKMLRIPLPPLEVQREIVGRIEAECKVVDGCKKLIALYEAKIKKVIDKVWEE